MPDDGFASPLCYGDWRFFLDVEATRALYAARPFVPRNACERNFAENCGALPAGVTSLLARLGVDASRPLEIFCARAPEPDEAPDYSLGYLAAGDAASDTGFAIDFGDVMVVPDRDADAGGSLPVGLPKPCFSVWVYGVRLPWTRPEPPDIPVPRGGVAGFLDGMRVAWELISASFREYFSRKA